MLKNLLALLSGILFMPLAPSAQPCVPQGDEVTYGTNDTWIGYVYDNMSLTAYRGYVNEGSPGNPNFDQSFGGLYANYPTNGCSVYTESFSARYRLRKTFIAGEYDFTIAGDDGFRFSIDGGATWLIDNWAYQGFNQNTVTVLLNGTYNLVIEYYDVAHHNRLSFAVEMACVGTENTSQYGSGNIWRGYVYNGLSFDFYKGIRNAGTSGSADFDENFGGNLARFNTSSCSLLAEHFTVRYRLNKNFPANNYAIMVGSEDGYRLSLDGGMSWAIDNWTNTTYTSTSFMSNLSGAYDMVLEYKETTGANRITFSAGVAVVLPVEFVSFSARNTGSGVALQWTVGVPGEAKHFEIEKSNNGQLYQFIGNSYADDNEIKYAYADQSPLIKDTYYRIKAVSKTGEVFYSRPIVISGDKKGVRIFPTSVAGGLLYLANEKSLTNANITFSNLTGRTVANYRLNNIGFRQTTSIILPSNLGKGMYIVNLEESGRIIKTEKIFIQ